MLVLDRQNKLLISSSSTIPILQVHLLLFLQGWNQKYCKTNVWLHVVTMLGKHLNSEKKHNQSMQSGPLLVVNGVITCYNKTLYMALWMVNLSYFTPIIDNLTCNWWWAPLCGTLQSKLVKLDSGDSATVPLYGKSLCQVRGICNQGTADGRIHTLAVGERVPHTLGSGDSHQCLTAGKRWSCKKRVHHSCVMARSSSGLAISIWKRVRASSWHGRRPVRAAWWRPRSVTRG